MSGAIAGLAGAIEVAGRTAYVTLDMSPGYGYSGIVIAMLAGLNPLGVVAASIFVAGVLVGADSMSRGVAVPTYIADVIVSVALAVDAGRDRVRALSAAVELIGNPAQRRLLGGGAAHRDTADLRHARRAAVRARRRAQPRHRRHHGRGCADGMARGLSRRGLVDRRGRRRADGRGVRAAARVPHGPARAVAARGGPRHHVVRDERVVLRVSRELSQRDRSAHDPAVHGDDVAADTDPRAADADDAARARVRRIGRRGCCIAHRWASPCAWSARIRPPPKARA